MIVEAHTMIPAKPRPGVSVEEFSARCGACSSILPRLASFRAHNADYILCSCGQKNVVRPPRTPRQRKAA